MHAGLRGLVLEGVPAPVEWRKTARGRFARAGVKSIETYTCVCVCVYVHWEAGVYKQAEYELRIKGKPSVLEDGSVLLCASEKSIQPSTRFQLLPIPFSPPLSPLFRSFIAKRSLRDGNSLCF